ncbi:MAG TPA: ABC transporter ATP-binding protein, partial [Spirochaetia bacterium]|nr:ABC transporter ATP-binding protein [Spirochaetia bacterium]
MPVLEAQGLTKWYGNVCAVDDVNLSLEAGEIYGFLGPNGAGKTTTMKMLVGVLPPTSGTVSFCSQGGEEKGLSCKIGVVPERPSVGVFPWMTGWEYVRFFAEMYGVSDWREKATEYAERLGILSFFEKRYTTYSAGMLQKLSIIRSLIHNPVIVFLDEPMSSLDPVSAKEVRDLIRDEQGQGKTIFVSSHILTDMEKLCSRIAVISSGRILAEGPTDEFIRQHGGGSHIVVELDTIPERLSETLLSLPFIRSVKQEGKTLVITPQEQGDFRRDVIEMLARGGCIPLSVNVRPGTLEDAFLSVIKGSEGREAGTEKKALPDEGETCVSSVAA